MSAESRTRSRRSVCVSATRGIDVVPGNVVIEDPALHFRRREVVGVDHDRPPSAICADATAPRRRRDRRRCGISRNCPSSKRYAELVVYQAQQLDRVQAVDREIGEQRVDARRTASRRAAAAQAVEHSTPVSRFKRSTMSEPHVALLSGPEADTRGPPVETQLRGRRCEAVRRRRRDVEALAEERPVPVDAGERQPCVTERYSSLTPSRRCISALPARGRQKERIFGRVPVAGAGPRRLARAVSARPPTSSCALDPIRRTHKDDLAHFELDLANSGGRLLLRRGSTYRERSPPSVRQRGPARAGRRRGSRRPVTDTMSSSPDIAWHTSAGAGRILVAGALRETRADECGIVQPASAKPRAIHSTSASMRVELRLLQIRSRIGLAIICSHLWT